jgi:acetate kinase
MRHLSTVPNVSKRKEELKMKILVLNCGSSSLKYQLINMETEEVLASGKYERIGEEEAFITHKAQGKKVEIKKPAYDHKEAIEFTLAQLTNPEYKVIDSLDEVEAIGHRVVHGGEIFKESAVIDEKVIEQIDECSEFAPLHNPAAILGMEACQKVMPGKPMVAVFDTTFHQTMPKEKYIYPIPYEYYKKYGVRKYGAHGTSHMYVSQRLGEIEKKNIEDLKIVTCHLGQGSSICAVDGGKSIDTSMGLTPLGGIPMVTRSGDLDPSVLTYLMKKENISAAEMENILNKKSGVAGISGLAPDFRVIELESYEDNERAKIAMESFNYSIASYIAKYAVAMKGVDYIIFTGGIGENQINIRKGICEKLTFMGVDIDVDANNMRGEEKVISKNDSKVKVYVIPTNEELMIAKETQRLVK